MPAWATAQATARATLCDACWHEQAAYQAISPGLLLGIILINVVFAFL